MNAYQILLEWADRDGHLMIIRGRQLIKSSAVTKLNVGRLTKDHLFVASNTNAAYPYVYAQPIDGDDLVKPAAAILVQMINEEATEPISLGLHTLLKLTLLNENGQTCITFKDKEGYGPVKYRLYGEFEYADDWQLYTANQSAQEGATMHFHGNIFDAVRQVVELDNFANFITPNPQPTVTMNLILKVVRNGWDVVASTNMTVIHKGESYALNAAIEAMVWFESFEFNGEDREKYQYVAICGTRQPQIEPIRHFLDPEIFMHMVADAIIFTAQETLKKAKS